MDRFGSMAGFAAPHGTLEFRGNIELRTLPAGDIMIGIFQILPKVKVARVKEQAFWPGG